MRSNLLSQRTLYVTRPPTTLLPKALKSNLLTSKAFATTRAALNGRSFPNGTVVGTAYNNINSLTGNLEGGVKKVITTFRRMQCM